MPDTSLSQLSDLEVTSVVLTAYAASWSVQTAAQCFALLGVAMAARWSGFVTVAARREGE